MKLALSGGKTLDGEGFSRCSCAAEEFSLFCYILWMTLYQSVLTGPALSYSGARLASVARHMLVLMS